MTTITTSSSTIVKPLRRKTLVELLVVIVVIAVLATISILTYSGMQVRARNTARIAAANGIYQQLEAYTRQTGNGFGADVFCIPTEANYDSGNGGLPDCYISSAPRSENAVVNSNFTSQNIKFSFPDTPVGAANGETYYGIHVTYFSHLNQGMDGVLRPYALWFNLEGSDQDCGQYSVTDIAAKTASDPLNSIVPARNRGGDAKRTNCFLSLTHRSAI